MTYYGFIIQYSAIFKFTHSNCVNKMLILKVDNEGLENQQKLLSIDRLL